MGDLNLSDFEVTEKPKCIVVMNKVEGTKFTIVEYNNKSVCVIFNYGFNEITVKKYSNYTTFKKACPNLSKELEGL
jgi:hypothetical protein